MAAGLGFKTFNTGDVLSAADVNGYLMQNVWVFANSAARTSAVTSPQEGNVSFLKDTNSLEIYDGAAWVAYGAGDITGVTAGTGISGGGTSGGVTITNSMATAIDAKGDLIVGTGADAFSRLAVGATNGHVLTIDSATATGLKWAAASGGGALSLISTTTLSTSTTTISITGTSYSRLVVVWDSINMSAGAQANVDLNGGTGDIYYANIQIFGSTFGNNTQYGGSTQLSLNGGQNFQSGNTANRGMFVLENVNMTSGHKPFYFYSSAPNTASGNPRTHNSGSGMWDLAAALTNLRFTAASGTFNGGTVRVFGVSA